MAGSVNIGANSGTHSFDSPVRSAAIGSRCDTKLRCCNCMESRVLPMILAATRRLMRWICCRACRFQFSTGRGTCCQRASMGSKSLI